VAGIAVASGQLINQSIKLGDVKRAINQSENSLSINQVKALKLEFIDYAHLCPNLPFIILSSFLLRDKLNPLTPFRVRQFIMTNISVLNLATVIFDHR